jgi:DNA (cytosine-5)-methyltransferase 1
MARLQSFPDSFRFYSKATTGGQSRRRDVPQYTQVGNAVPPWMALRIGLAIRQWLETASAGDAA